MKKFLSRVAEAKAAYAEAVAQGTRVRLFNPTAFDNYIRWLEGATRLELCPPAYEDDILEEPFVFDEMNDLEYNRLIRDGRQTSFAPVVNFLVIF